jgi:hypothetical protein
LTETEKLIQDTKNALLDNTCYTCCQKMCKHDRQSTDTCKKYETKFQRIRPDDQSFFEWLLEAPPLPDEIVEMLRKI